jgi:hypothetical protein
MHVVRACDLHLWRCNKLEKLERHTNCNLHLGSSGRDGMSCQQQLQDLPSTSYPKYNHRRCDKPSTQSIVDLLSELQSSASRPGACLNHSLRNKYIRTVVHNSEWMTDPPDSVGSSVHSWVLTGYIEDGRWQKDFEGYRMSTKVFQLSARLVEAVHHASKTQNSKHMARLVR